MIGNSNIVIDDASNIYVNDRCLRGTKGLWKMLTRKKPNTDLNSAEDYEKYKSILLMTNGHLEQYRPYSNVHVSREPNYRNVISKLFPRQARGQRRVFKLPGKCWIDC
jgi:hypothetical protein